MTERVVEIVNKHVQRLRHVETDAERQARESTEALREQVLQQAKAAEGLAVTSLTAAQQRALLCVLLHRAGALTDDLRIRPVREWAV